MSARARPLPVVGLFVSLAGLVPLTLSPAAPADARPSAAEADPTSAASRLERVRRTLADAEADADDVAAALAATDRQLEALDSELAASRRRVAQARDGARRAAVEAMVAEAARQRVLLVAGRRARSAYVGGPVAGLAALADARTASDLIDRTVMLDHLARATDAELEELKVADGRLADARSRVQQATTRLQATRASVEDQAARLRQTRQLRLRAKQALDAKVRRLRADADALRIESQRVSGLLRGGRGSTGSPGGGNGQLGYPARCPISSPFGPRWGRLHAGLDFDCSTGDPLAAAADGEVIEAGWAGAYGLMVVIDHGNGLATAYAHNSRLAVTAGQRVSRGQVIAYVGSTGRSTGSHAHFEVRVNGEPRNPRPYLS